jgi:hypothetical protein
MGKKEKEVNMSYLLAWLRLLTKDAASGSAF